MTNNQNRFEIIDDWVLVIICLLDIGDWNFLYILSHLQGF